MKVKNVSIHKIIACLTALFIFAFSMNYYSPQANASNTTRSYKVYNASTGAYLRSYTLNSLANTYQTRDVIGEDSREENYEHNGTVKIIPNDEPFGSGFVVDEHTIATAAHCLYDEVDDVFRSISEILLFAEDTNITGDAQAELSVTPVEYHIPDLYLSSRQPINYDYALITVEEDLSNYMGFELGAPLDSSLNMNVSITGFPKTVNGITVNDHTKHNMYTGDGKIIDINDFRIWYDNDTIGGNSGGPVYTTYTYNDVNYYTVIAIHTTSIYDNQNANSGTRITTDQLHFYKNNPNLNW